MRVPAGPSYIKSRNYEKSIEAGGSGLNDLGNFYVRAIGLQLVPTIGVAILLYFLGIQFMWPLVQLIGTILFIHIAMDRIFGYGLKFEKGFKFTHLGEIGKSNG